MSAPGEMRMPPASRCTFDAATHRYRIDGREVPSVTQTLTLAGLGPDYGTVAPAVRAYAAQRGTYCHQACAVYDQALVDDVPAARLKAWLAALDPVLQPYVTAWAAFRREHPAVIFTQTEALVWTDEDGGVAGTLDRAGTWDGTPCVLDLKTGAKVAWNTAHQLAAYTWLLVGADALDGVRRQVVHLKPDATYALPPPFEDARDLDDFRAALRVAWCKMRHGVRLP